MIRHQLGLYRLVDKERATWNRVYDMVTMDVRADVFERQHIPEDVQRHLTMELNRLGWEFFQ